jgi:cytochrome c oxidase cbb3-type subunit IV
MFPASRADCQHRRLHPQSMGQRNDRLDIARMVMLIRVWLDDSEVWTVLETIYLVALIIAFIAIVIWVFARKRKARFEADARIPLDNKKRDDHDYG